jgi:hypothetical protein
MYVHGGSNTSDSYLTDTWKFDGTTWTQIHTNNPTPVRDAFAMATISGKAFLFGGDTATGEFQDDVWTFDGTTWTQVTPSNSAPAGRVLARVLPWQGGALVWGGLNSGGALLNDTWTFDGARWKQLNVPRPVDSNGIIPGGANAAVLGSKIVFFSGDGAGFSDATFTFDGKSWKQLDFSSHPTVPGPRLGAAVTTIP